MLELFNWLEDNEIDWTLQSSPTGYLGTIRGHSCGKPHSTTFGALQCALIHYITEVKTQESTNEHDLTNAGPNVHTLKPRNPNQG